MATLLDPRFKGLKGLPRGEEVWTKLEVLLQERGKDTPNQEPRQEKSLLPSSLRGTDSPPRRRSDPVGAHSQLSVLARVDPISPAPSVPRERLFSAGHELPRALKM